MHTFPAQLPDWANLDVLHRNTLLPRTHFHLYSSEETARSRAAARVASLAGTWKFSLTYNPLDAPSGFESPSFDSAKWKDIQVPGMWQLQGFGRGPQYTNVQFPFFVDPPHPPREGNECGSYITHFRVPESMTADQLRLRFEGVDSAFHVWINGREVGYSQGSRNPSEFDITELTHTFKDNVLAVRVYQFCDGSYIEDQDQWWLSGIFRDVSLLGFPHKSRLEDINIQTLLDDRYKDATLKIEVEVTGTQKVDLKLLDAGGQVVTTTSDSAHGYSNETINFRIPVNDPEKWTAETPYLYELVVSLDDTIFTAHKVGFRRVEMKNGLIKVNGRRVVFKGANRHEHHPQSGRTVPYEFMRNDLLLMKKHNINAIRTCHQLNDPRLYDIADEIGLWVMDEADLECHGFEMIEDAALDPEQRKLPFAERQKLTRANAAKWTSDNPAWHDAYLDRARQLVHRDRLHPSIIIWSLGNEAFFGRNHNGMSKWIAEQDPTRLIHYEPDNEAEVTSMYSRMYASVDGIIAFAEDKLKTKPLVLCEYIHAMGTGPGNIKEYVDAFYKYPQLQGGWVWEWANHGLLTHTKDGEAYYGYGGDFGDVPNDYNFVMDGVLNSDHTPNSGLIEYKKAIEPVQLLSATRSTATIINRLDFATLDHLICKYSFVYEDKKNDEDGWLDIPKGVRPGATATLSLPKMNQKSKSEVILELSFMLKETTSWAEAGYELAFAQIPISPLSPIRKPDEKVSSTLRVDKSDTQLKISAQKCEWTIQLTSGSLVSWKKEGSEVICSPLTPSFYRAPTDNDAPKDGREWKEKYMHLAKIHTSSVEWCHKDDLLTVDFRQQYAPPVLSWSLDLHSRYTFCPSGSLRLVVKGKPQGKNLPLTLPRIGITVGLPKEFQKLQWFGRGPEESYKDMKLSQRIGSYHKDHFDDLWAGPEFPQECSNRTDTRWLNVASKDTSIEAQFFELENPDRRRLFDFMASHYDVTDIDEAQHPFQLAKKKKDMVLLRLDADHHGLGTGSCGPKTLEKYSLKTADFEFGILLY